MTASQNSPLWREVRAVFASPAKPVTFTLEVTIHANGKNIKALYVVDWDVDGNYIKRYTDEASVTVAIGAGTYNYLIVPFKSTLEVTLRYIPYKEKQTPERDQEQNILTYRFRGQLYDTKSETAEGNSPVTHDIDLADRTEMKTVKIQLMNLVTEQLRMKSWGGIIRQTTGINAIRCILGMYSKVDHLDTSVTVKGVTVAPDFNTEVREHIIVPPMTPIVQIPDAIDKECGGVYATGLAYYLKNNFWYVFSPYDTEAYKTSQKTLTLINIPANRLVEPERSYRETPTQVIVLITGEVKHKDLSEQAAANLGNGVRFVDASRVMNSFVKSGGNKAVADYGQNVNEFMIEGRETGLNYAPESDIRFTTNYKNEMAKLAQRNGAMIQVVWENANDSILYPGMPVKYMYLQNQTSAEVYGILIGCHSFSTSTTKSVTNRRFTTHCALTLFIEKDIPVTTSQ